MSIPRSSPPALLIDARAPSQSDRASALKAGEPSAPIRRATAIPWGVVGMIALIVVIEWFFGRNWLDFTDPVSLSWRYSAEVVATESPGSELLCLGDSLIKHGLLPGVIEEETGRRTVNLSAARAPALLTYFFLRRAIDAGARPPAIIINAKPAVLLAGPEFNARYWQEVLTPREGLEFSLMTRDGPFMLATVLGRLLPSLRCRLEIRSQVMAAVRGEIDPIPGMNRILLRNWNVNGGANVAAVRSERPDDDGPEIERRLHPGIFFVDPTNAEGMERLFQLAAAHEVPVFWLLPPLSPVLQSLRDQSGAEAGYERFVKSFVARYPRLLTVLDARRGGYPAAFFSDHTHLNRQGALALSRAVARAVGPRLAPMPSEPVADWVVLPRLAASADGPARAVEDLEQSRRILSRRGPAVFSSR